MKILRRNFLKTLITSLSIISFIKFDVPKIFTLIALNGFLSHSFIRAIAAQFTIKLYFLLRNFLMLIVLSKFNSLFLGESNLLKIF